MRRSVYVASPFSGDPHGNVDRARRWVKWLMEREPDVAFQCSWMTLAMVLDDSDPEHRERALRDCVTLAGACDGIVLVGGRVSPGMTLELDACIAGGGVVYDLTSLGADPLGVTAELTLAMSEWGGPLNYGALAWEAA